MGKFIDIGNDGFRSARKTDYVDKSLLIDYVNGLLGSEHKFLCVTRARRFGKSMAAKMLNAYYDESCDSAVLFDDLKIAGRASYAEHRNRYPVIYLDITYFTTTCRNAMSEVVEVMEREVKKELAARYPMVLPEEQEPLASYLVRIVDETHKPFIMIVDEWDAICREEKTPSGLMRDYVDWLRSMFKTSQTDKIFAGVYMTGILPIIQYDTQSALNNFHEYTMIKPGRIVDYFGFSREEVQVLAEKNGMQWEELEKWYDGYQLGETKGIYNPYSVMQSLLDLSLDTYWTATGSYESLKKYISMNYDGLKDSVLELLAGGRVKVNVLCFNNNLHEVHSRDAVLTVLVHLGYLSYDKQTETVTIPNLEVQKEFEKSVMDTSWTHVAAALRDSEQVLRDTLAGDGEAVAKAIEQVHQDSASVLQYNDENSLACALNLAYYVVRKDYTVVRELPTGKGFADLVLIPHVGVESPAIVVELKYNKSADTAIRQIREKHYLASLKDWTGVVVLVGINYDKKTKAHQCVIERVETSNSKNVGKNVEKNVGKELTERQQVILILLAADGSLSAKDLSEKMSEKMSEKKMSDRTIERYIKQLQDLGYLSREGGRKDGRWVVLK